MASLTIKNIPNDLYEQLKQAANVHHRSINSELIVCLEKVLLPGRKTPQDHISAARILRKRVKAPLVDVATIEAARNEGRL